MDMDRKITQEDWDAVRDSSDLLRTPSMALFDQPVRLLVYSTSIRNYLIKLACAPAAESITVSDLGTLDGSTKDADSYTWTIDHVVISQSSHVAGPVLNFNIASMKDGAMTITVNWWPGMIGIDLKHERQFVGDVCSNIARGLEAVAQQPNSIITRTWYNVVPGSAYITVLLDRIHAVFRRRVNDWDHADVMEFFRFELAGSSRGRRMVL